MAKIIPSPQLIKQITKDLDSFECCICSKTTPTSRGTRRVLNMFIDVYHCLDCCAVPDEKIVEHIKRYIDEPIPEGVDEVAEALATSFMEWFVKNKSSKKSK